MDAAYTPLVDFLTANFPNSGEIIILGQAFSAALAIKNGKNRDGDLHWFHAFTLTVLAAFSGGLFNVMWMGKPTPMIANDFVLAACIISFTFVNYFPFGNVAASTIPAKIVITMCSTLFKSMGLVNFITTAFNAFGSSKYYDISVLGPVWYGTMLGNMGGFFSQGVDGYVGNGMPWGIQNGIICGPFFHFYAHDENGPIGTALRAVFSPVHGLVSALDNRTFAIACVGLFMQVVSILQMPFFLGPSFTPIAAIGGIFSKTFSSELFSEQKLAAIAKEVDDSTQNQHEELTPTSAGKKKSKNKKKKQKKA